MQNEYHDGPEEYEFLQEKIKDQDTKEQVRRGLPKIIGTGLLFGMCASIAFCFMTPILEKHFGNVEEVNLVDDTDEEESETETVTDPVVIDPVNVEVDVKLDLDHYKQLQQQLSSIGKTASSSLVTITGVTNDDPGEEAFYSQSPVTGLLIADNGRELLILGKTISTKKVDSIEVTFSDTRTYTAQLKKGYNLLGYSVYSVDKSVLSDKTRNKITIAELANRDSVQAGDTLICLGSPYGYSNTMVYTTAINTKNSITKIDGEYKLITTDLTAAAGGTGILVDLSGKVVGIADGSISEDTGCNQLFGYEISGITTIIENLSNGKSIPYTGVNGYTVTRKMQETGIPSGIYVDSVANNSPAMEAGLQTGDIIVSINHTSVTSLSAYQSSLLEAKVGDTITVVGMRFSKNSYKEITFKIELPFK